MISRRLALILALLATAIAGCDDDADDEAQSDVAYVLSGDTAEDENIAADLARYIAYNYGRPDEPDPELTPRQRERVGDLEDNILGLRTSIEGISVSNSVVTVETNLDWSDESTTTAELICTVIYGADVADRTEGHEVRAGDGSTLAHCTPDTSPFARTG